MTDESKWHAIKHRTAGLEAGGPFDAERRNA
jgi:hypothetical protein